MSSPEQEAALLDRWVPWLLGALVVAVVLWPWPLHPLHTLGAPDLEADNHLWMLWRGVQWVLGDPGPHLNWPVGEGRHLLDVVHVPLAALGMTVDPALGYGLVAGVDVALAVAGGWWIAREAGATRAGALTGMVVLGAAPVLQGLVVHGLAEDWPVGLYALHVAALLRTGRTGSWRAAAVASLCLVAYAHAGWYAALFAALASPAVLVWIWRLHRPTGRAWVAILLAGACAVLLVVPQLASFLAHESLDEVATRWTPTTEVQLGWRSGTPPPAPPWGADPVNLVVPMVADQPMPRSVYLGLVALALAAVGAGRRVPARYPLVGLALLCFLALGHHVLLAGRPWIGPAPLLGPGATLAALAPPLRGVASWYRAVAPATVFLAAAASLGADVLLDRLRGAAWAPAFALFVLVDATAFSGATWPRPTYDPRPPAALAGIPGDEPMLLLPVDRGQEAWRPYVPRVYQRWQPWLGRPITESYEYEDAVLGRHFVGWASWVCDGPRHEVVDLPAHYKLPLPEARQAAQSLRRDGIGVVAVVRWRLRSAERCESNLIKVLGEAQGGDEEVLWWRLDLLDGLPDQDAGP